MSNRSRKNRNGGRANTFNRDAQDRWFDEGGSVDSNHPRESESYRSSYPGGYYSGRPDDRDQAYPSQPRREQGSGSRRGSQSGYRDSQGNWQQTQNWTTSENPGWRNEQGFGQSGYEQSGYGRPWYGPGVSDYGDYSRSGSYSGGMTEGPYGHSGSQQYGGAGSSQFQGGMGYYPMSGNYGHPPDRYENTQRPGYVGPRGYSPEGYANNPEGAIASSCPWCSGQMSGRYGRHLHSVSNWGMSQPSGFFGGQDYGPGYYTQPRGAYGREGSGQSFRGENYYGQDFTSSQRPFPNRGPKGYKRSDERIQEDVNDALSDGTIDASEITVKVQNGEVVLTGSVPDRRMKFIAESCAEDVMGVSDVTNQLKVDRSSAQTSHESFRGTASGSSSQRESNQEDSPSGSQRSTAKSSMAAAR